jgi:hypothetical protein
MMEATRTTSAVTIEAMAPPAAGRPADFSGATGSFKMQVSADRSAAAVGEAVGVKVTLTGTGNLKTVDHPLMAPSADFRVFDPRIEEKASGLKPRSYTKTWSYVLTPLSPGDLTLPEIAFNYFDPETKTYKRLSSEPNRIAVKRPAPGAAVESSPVLSAKREVQPLQRDIRFLKALDSPLQRSPEPLRAQWWIWMVVSLAVLAQPAAWILHARGGPASLLPGGRHGRARRRALSEIAGARTDQADRTKTAARAAEALLRFLSERSGIPAHGLTYEEIGGELERRGVSAEVRGRLRSLLEMCDLGRFAPEASRSGESAQLLEEAGSLVEALDRQIGRAA